MTTKNQSLGDFVNGKSFLQVLPDTLIREVAIQMPANHSSAAVIVDEDDRLIGILTEQDIVERAIGARRDVDETTAEQIMTSKPITVQADAPLGKALEIMTENGFRALPVMKGYRVIGIIDIRDLYATLNKIMQEEINLKDGLVEYAFYGDGYGARYRKSS